MPETWERFPELLHLSGAQRASLEKRRRHRKVRYLLYTLRTATEKGAPLESVPDLPPGFIEFWLGEKPAYAADTRGGRIEVPVNRNKPVAELGGYGQFASKWDVDPELEVYLRHSSVWQEWNAQLMRVVPVLGE